MLFFACFSLPVSAQSTIHGHIRDTALKKGCPLAVVAVLSPDSSLIQFTRTRKDGSFTITNLPAGGYRLLVTHPGYNAYTQSFVLKGEVLELGHLSLPPRSQDLAAVVVTPKVLPPKMKGDTLEYATANIKTRVNATVEELLVRLPGVQVDQNGNITVNGKKIDKLLVDGQDFFGGDPKIVTRNFNADMIAKVQVLDKKSDQSNFTGIDDGTRTKTLNLTLKEDSKKGYFGKLEAGGDPQGYYNVNGLLGSFKDGRQFAALGMTGNAGSTGFSGDVGSLGSGLNIGSGGGDALSASAGGGIPRVVGGGVHYANKLTNNGDHLTGNYAYGRSVTDPFTSSITKQLLPDSIYTQRQLGNSHNFSDQHSFDGDYDYIPDTLSAFHFSLGELNSRGRNQFLQTGNSSFNDTLVNDSYRAINDDVTNQSFRGSIMWRIRGRHKKERMFSIVTGLAQQNNSTDGYLYSRNSFYKHGDSLLSRDTLDQRKVVSTDGLFFNSSLNYSEPLWKNASLGFSYGFSFNRSQSLLSTYDRGDGKYQNYVDSLSNHYRNDVITHRATISLQGRDKDFGYSLGGDILQFGYNQQDLVKEDHLRYHYLNLSPRINSWYNLNSYTGFNFNYNGNSQQPSISQLQPVQNNNDPLHITLGNPDLRPGFSHSFGIGFHNLRPIVINAGLNYNFTTKAISTRTYTDSLGRQISQAVNTQGGSNEGLYLSINHHLKKLNLDIGSNVNLGYGQNFNYVNQYLSKNSSYFAGFGIFANQFVSDKYSFQLNSNANYSYSNSSINPSATTHYWTSSHNVNFSLLNVAGFEINSTLNYNWRQKIDDFDKHNTTILWNGFIGHNFLKNQLSVRWQINDILGQNVGINRSISANQTSETTTNIIGRYWMLVASWRFVYHKKAD